MIKVLKGLVAICSKDGFVLLAIIFAIILRMDYELKFADFYADKSYQVYAAKSINDGTGCSIVTADPNDLSKDLYRNLEGYPPGYSYLIAFLSPTISYHNAANIIDVLAIILLVVATFVILKNLEIKNVLKVLFLFFIAITPSPFGYLSSTDLLVSSFFMASIAFFIKLYRKPGFLNTRSQHRIFLGVLIYVPLYFKYSALPLILVIPGVLIILSIIHKNIKYFLHASMALLVVLVLFVMQKLILPDYPKEKVFANGFFPKQLLQMDDFAFKAFYYLEFYITAIKASFQGIGSILTIASLLISFGLIFFIIYDAAQRIKAKNKDAFTLFSFITAVCVALLLGFLSFLSLRIPGETWQNPPWTYVEETRYYASAMILLQVFIFIYALSNKGILAKGLKYFIFGALIFSSLYWLKQNYNLYIAGNDAYTFASNYKKQLDICSYITPLKRDGEKIIYCSTSEQECIFNAIHAPIDNIIDFRALIKSNLESSSPLKLFIHCSKQEMDTLLLKFPWIHLKTIKNNDELSLYLINI
ncbi:MAG: hypothetical protein JEZ09_11930 [Salinivirgaceae bacterium]|nr:hypothetical protein [Salinivirgaceae bacterium]